jgi:hypothetical protein
VKGEGRRGKGDEKALLELFGRLPPRQQGKLMAFAEALARDAAPARRQGARPGARPAGETVARAIRRLTRAYPMLDRRRLMPEACNLMAQHALHGRAAAEVILELETVFEKHHEQFKANGEGRKAKGKRA